jgi:hypothetical protein
MLFGLIFQPGFGRRLRRLQRLFRRGGGSSQRFLWHRPFSQKGLHQKRLRQDVKRLLATLGAVRANLLPCVKEDDISPSSDFFSDIISLSLLPISDALNILLQIAIKKSPKLFLVVKNLKN